MALEKAVDILKYADEQKRCVIGFDAFNLESIKWISDTAEEEQIPVIMMIYPADKKNEEIMFLGIRAASKYRCMVIGGN